MSEICGKREGERELIETVKKVSKLGLRVQGLETASIKVSLLKISTPYLIVTLLIADKRVFWCLF